MLKLLQVLFIFCFATCAYAQVGNRFVQNYIPKEYKAYSQNWTATQDKRGIMYFGNLDGVLEYDGVEWNLIKLPEESSANVVKLDSMTNRVYVGGVGQFGYLKPNKKGLMEYQSLVPKLPKEYKDLVFQDVWTIEMGNGKVYFQASEALMAYNPLSDTVEFVVDPPASLGHCFFVHNRLLIMENSLGMMELKGNKLELMKGGEAFHNDYVFSVLELEREELLIVGFKTGFYHATKEGIVTKITSALDQFISQTGLFYVNRLPQNKFFFAFLASTNMVVDANFNVLEMLNEENGLQDAHVNGYTYDKDGILWLTLNNGISKVELLSPFQKWDVLTGMSAMILSINEFNGLMYVGTMNGLYRVDNQKVESVGPNMHSVWDLKVYTRTDGKKVMLAATTAGIFEIDENGKVRSLFTLKSGFQIKVSDLFPHRMYFGTDHGVLVLEEQGGAWKVLGEETTSQSEVRSIVETKTGDLWLATAYQGVQKIEFEDARKLLVKKVHLFDSASGLPTMNWVSMFEYKDKLLCATSFGFYEYDEKRNRFVASTLLPADKAKRDIFRMAGDGKGGFYIGGLTTSKGAIAYLSPNSSGAFDVDERLFRRLPSMGLEALFVDSKGKLWLGGSEGLYCYDSQSIFKHPKRNFALSIRKIFIGNDSLFFGGTFVDKEGKVIAQQADTEMPSVEYAHRNIVFHFAAHSYFDERQTLYSHILEGYDEEWSHWTSETRKEYTNLAEGEYVFKVKAKDVFGDESSIKEYRFCILPPWYRTWWAYTLYVLFISGTVYFLVWLNTARLRRDKARLERIVEQRTEQLLQKNNELEEKQAVILEKNAELAQQKEEIMTQAENLLIANEQITDQRDALSKTNIEIAKKNADITASINYASRIQSAVLPPISKIKQTLPDSFVFFRPRDIVSGDFYWYNCKETSENEFTSIIAAVDCTGHGVPGAFMSMIGIDLLNLAVFHQGYQEPGAILNELNQLIISSLRQGSQDVPDGMDLSLCVLKQYKDQEGKIHTRSLAFGGAKNPLLLVTAKDLTILTPEKQSIGGQMTHKRVPFTTQHVDITEPTKIYLFSDGYQDQFGGPEEKRFGSARLRSMLKEMFSYSMARQEQVLEQTMLEWLGHNKQIDDVLVMGILLNP